MTAAPSHPAPSARTELLAEVRRLVEATHHKLEPEGAGLEALADLAFAQVGTEDLLARGADELHAIVLSHWHLAARRRPGEVLVHVGTPGAERDGWACGHTVVQVVVEDMPFVVDTVRLAAIRCGFGILLVVHPVVDVRRDGDGRLLEVAAPPGEGVVAESWTHLQVERTADPARLQALELELRRVLGDVRVVVDDRAAMAAQVRAVAEELRAGGDAGSAEDAALLDWLLEDHFTLLGSARYTAEPGEDLRPVAGTGLGLLRSGPAAVAALRDPPTNARLLVTKADRRSEVHRPAHLDEVRVQQVGAYGAVVGTWRLLGLFASTAYRTPVADVPVVRRKVQAVWDAIGLDIDSHSGKALRSALETYWRDELFAASTDEVLEGAQAVARLEERRLVRVLTRRDQLGAYWAVQVFLPRDRYTTAVRSGIEAQLLRTLGGSEVEWDTTLGDSILARLTFRVYGPDLVATVDRAALEERVQQLATAWVDQLRQALVDQLGEAEGTRVFQRFADGIPPGYAADRSPGAAVADLRALDGLTAEAPSGLLLARPLEAPPDELRLRLYRLGPPVVLSDLLPVLGHLGVTVVDQRPYELHRTDGSTATVSDLGLRVPPGTELTTGALDALRAAFDHVERGLADDDGFNRLVLAAGLDWREVVVVRAYARYLRQVGSTFSEGYVQDVLAAHPEVVHRLLALFHLRFDPADPRTADERADAAEPLVTDLEARLDAVASLDEDRILRSFVALVRATVRTNLFTGAPGELPPALALKLDPRRVPDLPPPVPEHEVFVHSPRVEGVHLRAGAVARGGIRWSDRREDFRTEVLGLMKAQVVKNAVIVPTGAKGGFVVRRPPADRAAAAAEGRACYELFIAALLDVTDDRRGGVVVPPAGVVRHDGDDPYLVVAADKGTASFSDLANSIAVARGFWLGDAFASGGSTGYDHKAMGITAKGAWESVRRHFQLLGVDADTAPLTVVGVGDMSGDVFGNGLLRSEHLRLVAAFDHRHVFIDPDPDPATSFAERLRLFRLPASSWDDYDKALLSRGGGVFPRTAKRIDLSPEARAVLGIEAEHLTPPELVHAVLAAPVDLLWNGGIGTYVKGVHQADAEVGDKANDALRLTAAQVRVRVVAEGGNLGVTQQGRVELALRGVRINTDAIDNSAGVDCSDHEVNLKVLLDHVVAEGDLTVKQRNELLASMEDEVAALVLQDNADQTRALALAERQAPGMLDVHRRLIAWLEQRGRLDRALEALPDADALNARKAAGQGLVAPELAVLLAVVKTTLVAELLAGGLPEDPYWQAELLAYFPAAVRSGYADAIAAHPLRREIVATAVANRVVNQAGTTFVFRMEEQAQADGEDAVRAFAVARDLFDLGRTWDDLEALDGRIDADVQRDLLLALRRLGERSARWLVRHHPGPWDLTATVARLRPTVSELVDVLPTVVAGDDRAAWEARRDAARSAGVPDVLAARVASTELLAAGLDLAEVALATGLDVALVAGVHVALDTQLGLARLRAALDALPRGDRWSALAREALRDDLAAAQRATVEGVLAGATDGADATGRVASWLADHHLTVGRFLRLLGDLDSAEVGLATLSVVLRELRGLALLPAAAGTPAGAPAAPAELA